MSFSIERVLVGLGAGVAVAVQGLLESLWPTTKPQRAHADPFNPPDLTDKERAARVRIRRQLNAERGIRDCPDQWCGLAKPDGTCNSYCGSARVYGTTKEQLDDAEDLADKEAEEESSEPTRPSRGSLIDAYWKAKTPEVERQALNDLDRYYPNFAGAAASLADGRLSAFAHEPQEPSVREEKRPSTSGDAADPQPKTSPVEIPVAAGDEAAGGVTPASPAATPDVETYEITIHRSELIPGGNGARIGFSDDFPDKQFLIIPQ